jgi:hypothetical protein
MKVVDTGQRAAMAGIALPPLSPEYHNVAQSRLAVLGCGKGALIFGGELGMVNGIAGGLKSRR